MKKEETSTLTLQDIINDKTEEIVENESSELVSLIAIAELTNLKKLKTITRIKEEQIPILSKLYLFSDKFKIPFMRNLADNVCELQISIRGLGRRDLVSVVNQSQPPILQNKSLFSANKEVFR